MHRGPDTEIHIQSACPLVLQNIPGPCAQEAEEQDLHDPRDSPHSEPYRDQGQGSHAQDLMAHVASLNRDIHQRDTREGDADERHGGTDAVNSPCL